MTQTNLRPNPLQETHFPFKMTVPSPTYFLLQPTPTLLHPRPDPAHLFSLKREPRCSPRQRTPQNRAAIASPHATNWQTHSEERVQPSTQYSLSSSSLSLMVRTETVPGGAIPSLFRNRTVLLLHPLSLVLGTTSWTISLRDLEFRIWNFFIVFPPFWTRDIFSYIFRLGFFLKTGAGRENREGDFSFGRQLWKFIYIYIGRNRGGLLRLKTFLAEEMSIIYYSIQEVKQKFLQFKFPRK